MELALDIEGLSKSYGTTRAVTGVDLRVEEGQIVGVVGPNGSGKTTTVECAYGLRKADAGTVRVFGLDARAEPDRVARLVGTQLQDSALPDRVKVWEALHLFAALAGRPVDEAEALRRWGLTGKRTAGFGSLSGGERQRLLVALALVGRPRLVFLDEMTTGLDPNARREVWELVEEVRRGGTTVVLVTHFMDEAQRLCDKVAVLHRGRKVAEGTPAQLVDRYGGGTVARFRSPVFGDTPDPNGDVFRGVGGATYYLPAYIGLVVASLGLIGLPVHLASYRERGVLRRLQAARVPVRALLASQLVVLAVGVGAGAVLLMTLAGFSWDVRWPASWPGLVLALALGTVAFASIGMLLGALMPTARAAQGLGLLLWFTMMMVSGAGPPPEVLSRPLATAGDLLPLKHLVIALQDPWLGYGVNWAQMATLLAISVAAALLAAPALRRRR